MSEYVWNTDEGVSVIIGDESLSVQELTADVARQIAREHGIRKFILKKDGEILSPEDLPVTSGTVEIEEYNEAK